MSARSYRPEGWRRRLVPATGTLTRVPDDLARWSAEARADAAAAARAKERWLRHQAGEDATLAGLLVDLAERRMPAVVVVDGDRRHWGTLTAVGADYVLLREAADRDVYVALAAISAVRPDAVATGDTATPPGSRPVEADSQFAAVLATLAADRPRVAITAFGTSEAWRGELRGAGRDLVVVHLDGGARSTAYIPVAAIAEVVVV
jgi:hypothetical protein